MLDSEIYEEVRKERGAIVGHIEKMLRNIED